MRSAKEVEEAQNEREIHEIRWIAIADCEWYPFCFSFERSWVTGEELPVKMWRWWCTAISQQHTCDLQYNSIRWLRALALALALAHSILLIFSIASINLKPHIYLYSLFTLVQPINIKHRLIRLNVREINFYLLLSVRSLRSVHFVCVRFIAVSSISNGIDTLDRLYVHLGSNSSSTTNKPISKLQSISVNVKRTKTFTSSMFRLHFFIVTLSLSSFQYFVDNFHMLRKEAIDTICLQIYKNQFKSCTVQM